MHIYWLARLPLALYSRSQKKIYVNKSTVVVKVLPLLYSLIPLGTARSASKYNVVSTLQSRETERCKYKCSLACSCSYV